MTKIIGLKDLQQNTKRIREEVAEGVSFVVIYRSKPVFEIRPLGQEWLDEDRYRLAESALEFWNGDDDDNIFDESVSL